MVILLFAGGGLGNQMFQYAYARYIQIRFEDTLQLNIYGFKRDKRKYALKNFNIPTDVTIRKKKKKNGILLNSGLSERFYSHLIEMIAIYRSYITNFLKEEFFQKLVRHNFMNTIQLV